MKKLWPVPDCRIEQITPDGPAHLHIAARSFLRGRRCPDCGRISRAVHSRYERHLADLPSLGRSVSVHLWVRRFYCRNIDCARQTFVERLPKLAVPFARRTDRLAAAQGQTGLALGGEASARLLSGLSMPVSADTVLRLIRQRRCRISQRPVLSALMIGRGCSRFHRLCRWNSRRGEAQREPLRHDHR
jgi:zinc-finger of transposase IS204/IS1001/IS1096/IS1165